MVVVVWCGCFVVVVVGSCVSCLSVFFLYSLLLSRCCCCCCCRLALDVAGRV